jgi:GAF domain-containing protein
MARQSPLATQLVADLFVAIEECDPLATLEATQALADRIGSQAAVALARALLADRRTSMIDPALLQAETTFQPVACA